MEKELNKIVELIDQFNRISYDFKLELNIRKKDVRKFLSLDEVMKFVSGETGIHPEYIRMKTRETKIVIPRQLCMYMATKTTNRTYTEIGHYFGNKDHATVTHAVKSINNLIETNSEFRDRYKRIIYFGSKQVV